jgi:hypothetical protein
MVLHIENSLPRLTLGERSSPQPRRIILVVPPVHAVFGTQALFPKAGAAEANRNQAASNSHVISSHDQEGTTGIMDKAYLFS